MSYTTTYSIKHLTDYRYSDSVSLAYNEARLCPRSFYNTLVTQQCLDAQLVISPEPQDKSSREDYFGNQITYFNFTRSHKSMSVLSSSLVKRTTQLSKSEVVPYLKDTLCNLTWQDALAVKQTSELWQLSLSSSLCCLRL